MSTELIKPSEVLQPIENPNGMPYISARNLHMALNVKTRYNDWIERNLENFIENQDFKAITQKRVTAQGNETTFTDHHLAIDVAKHIAMMTRGDRGKLVRNYFIEIERRYNDPLYQMQRVLTWAQNQMQQKDAQIEHQRLELLDAEPKIEMYNFAMDAKNTLNMGEISKVLRIPGLGRNNLFAFLRDKGVLDDKNIPYQEHINAQRFRTHEVKKGKQIGTQTTVYQKGLEYIIKLLKEDGHDVPELKKKNRVDKRKDT
nr:MAG TPA: antirepressor protein [Caudoviricetes sp.]